MGSSVDTVNESRLTPSEATEGKEILDRIIANVEQVVIGKRSAIELILIAMMAKGHVLIEDVPGVGKTTMVSSVAKSINCGFKRIQFTPDLMPSDVTGFSVYNQKSGEFEFRPGGVMSNLILADEINRASAKTQAALLEAMEEKQVTVDSETYRLNPPFMVLATQNPVESFGTYPLPEAQLDRFTLKFSLGYPTMAEEGDVICIKQRKKEMLGAAASQEEVLKLCDYAERVYVSRQLVDYIVQLVTATRTSPDTVLGSSPRGGIALSRTAQALALMRGRIFVTPDDIKYMAPFVLAHRLHLSHEARIAKHTVFDVVERALDDVLVPAELPEEQEDKVYEKPI